MEDNEFKNHKLEQSLKQKLKKEANLSFRNKGNELQYEFILEQLAKLEEANPHFRLDWISTKINQEY